MPRLATRNKYDVPSNTRQTALSHECMPFLEYDIPRSPLHKYYPEIPFFSTHVPIMHSGSLKTYSRKNQQGKRVIEIEKVNIPVKGAVK